MPRDSGWRSPPTSSRSPPTMPRTRRTGPSGGTTRGTWPRAALDLAGADSTRYRVWLGDDYAGLEADRVTQRVVGDAGAFALDLRLVPERPPVVHGERGVSQKAAGAGNASHYYSFTRLAT